MTSARQPGLANRGCVPRSALGRHGRLSARRSMRSCKYAITERPGRAIAENVSASGSGSSAPRQLLRVLGKAGIAPRLLVVDQS